MIETRRLKNVIIVYHIITMKKHEIFNEGRSWMRKKR